MYRTRPQTYYEMNHSHTCRSFITTIPRDVHRLESTVPRKLALVIYMMKGQPRTFRTPCKTPIPHVMQAHKVVAEAVEEE